MNESLPTAEELRASLIDSLRFEGEQGLWEVVWRLNHSHPAVSLDAKVGAARHAVLGLLNDGRIGLSVAKWPARDGRPLSPAEMDRLRDDDTPWFDPDRASDLLVWIDEAD